MENDKAISRLFDFFYARVYKGSHFKLDLSIKRNKSLIDSFFKALSVYYPIDSVGLNFLLGFFSFAFGYYANKTTKYRISLNWIIGKTMVKKFFEKKQTTQFYVDRFLKEYNIDLTVLHSTIVEEDLEERGLDPAEELEKLRFVGEAKLYNCLQHTTLYNHLSINCIGCVNRSPCKALLKKSNPRLFDKRGYQ